MATVPATSHRHRQTDRRTGRLEDYLRQQYRAIFGFLTGILNVYLPVYDADKASSGGVIDRCLLVSCCHVTWYPSCRRQSSPSRTTSSQEFETSVTPAATAPSSTSSLVTYTAGALKASLDSESKTQQVKLDGSRRKVFFFQFSP